MDRDRKAPRGRFELRDAALNRRLDELLDAAGATDEVREPVRQTVVAALRLVSDQASRGDARLVANAVKELRHAFRVFAPYENVRKVAVFGSARTRPGEPAWEAARTFAARIVARGWMVITGAGDGVMGAAQEGAGREASFGVNIRLPWEQRPNPVIAGDPKLINFRYFFTRKLAFLKQAHAIALFPGGYGTHDEAFEALTLIQTGRSEILPVVCIDVPGGRYWSDWARYVESHLLARGLVDRDDLALFRVTDDLDAAVQETIDFYRNYHSSRFVEDLLVLRVRVPPDPEALAALNREFAALCVTGEIAVRAPLPEERGEVPDHARLVLHFDRRRAGLLRRLIDRLNLAVADRTSPREASPRALPEGEEPLEGE